MTKTEKLPSGNYRTRVCWTEDGVKHYRSFTDKNKVVSRNLASEFELNRNRCKISCDTLADTIFEYIESQKNTISPTTYKQYTSYAKNYLLDLQKMRVCDIKNPDIQSAFNYEAGRHSPKTVRNLYSLFSMVMRSYRPDFHFVVSLPRVFEKKSKIPTEHEFRQIISLADDDMKVSILLAGVQGMRKGEVLGLKWVNVDFDKEVIIIDETIVKDIDGNDVHKSPKTRAGIRTIPLLPPVKEALIGYSEKNGKMEYIINISGPALSGRFKRINNKLGLNYTFHELRHYACSVMLSRGVARNYVASFLGHETERMVERVYGHTMPRYINIFADNMKEYYNENPIFPDDVGGEANGSRQQEIC